MLPMVSAQNAVGDPLSAGSPVAGRGASAGDAVMDMPDCCRATWAPFLAQPLLEGYTGAGGESLSGLSDQGQRHRRKFDKPNEFN
jgi:hypothetical protein